VPGGKLVRVKLEVENNQISKASVTGDFFMHPEDFITKIEETLTNLPENSTQEELEDKLTTMAKEFGESTLYGASLADIAEVTYLAINSN